MLGIQRRRAVNLTAKTELGILLGADNAAASLAQTRQDFLGVVAERGDDAHSSDDHSPHACLVQTSSATCLMWEGLLALLSRRSTNYVALASSKTSRNKPTLRSLAR